MKLYFIGGFFILFALSSYLLFDVTFEVQKLRHHLESLNSDIQKEQNSIHGLKVEWSSLIRPDNLEVLVQRALPDMKPDDGRRIVSLKNLSSYLENRKEKEGQED